MTILEKESEGGGLGPHGPSPGSATEQFPLSPQPQYEMRLKWWTCGHLGPQTRGFCNAMQCLACTLNSGSSGVNLCDCGYLETVQYMLIVSANKRFARLLHGS